MRILFINTTDVAGGAAVVMQRLMKGLHEQYKTESHVLVKEKKGTAVNTTNILSNRAEIIAEKIIDRITRPLGLLYQTFPFSSRNMLSFAKTYKPDIISLHNTHGAYFATPLIKKLSKIAPIVWTLHDMWSFTGNASHTFGNTSWKLLKNDSHLKTIPPAIGINTGAYLLRQKKRIYQKADLTVVMPSLWLKGLAEQSPVFEGKRIYQVFNGIDPNVFHPLDKQQAKQQLGLPIDSPTIMFSSHFIDKNNPWKGGTDLLQILERINAHAKQKINFLVLGEGKLDELNAFHQFNPFFKGYITSEKAMNECLNAADLFIYPTRADNLPNVLVESIACGTPCITFDIGGNSEIIRHGYNGVIIKPFDFEAFALNTLDLLKDENKRAEYSQNCLKQTKELFYLDNMVNKYYSLFNQLT